MKAYLFYTIAATILAFSFLSVSSRRILRSAVYLLFVLIATAGLYFMFNYNFLAAVQLTIYAGGIIVLIIFSIMLTSQLNEKLERPNALRLLLAGLASFTGISTILYIISVHQFPTIVSEKIYDVKEIAAMLISSGKYGYALPFEVISVLLLAAMIGAIVLAKKEQNTEQ